MSLIIFINLYNGLLWPPHAKSWLIGKDSDAGKDWGQEEKGMAEDEMAGWHHWLDGRESEWTPGVGDGQGGLACCDSWGHRESDTTEQLNWTELNWTMLYLISEHNKKSSVSKYLVLNTTHIDFLSGMAYVTPETVNFKNHANWYIHQNVLILFSS